MGGDPWRPGFISPRLRGGRGWPPNVVQLETQDADAGQLVSFGLDRPNQRGAAAEADVNAHTSRHDCCFVASVPHRAAGTPQDAVGGDTTPHNLPCLLLLIPYPNWRAKVIGTAIGSRSQLESFPRLVSHSESQCGEAKVAVRPSRRPSQLCSAATERYLQAKATARSRLHLGPSDAHARHMGFIRPRQFARPPANLHAQPLTPTPLHHDPITHICTSPSPLGTPNGSEHRTSNPRTRSRRGFKDTIGSVLG